MTCNIIFFFAETDTVGAERDTIGAKTENISAETERFFNKREDFKYKGGPSVLYGCRKRQNRKCRKKCRNGWTPQARHDYNRKNQFKEKLAGFYVEEQES
ncbi:Uncharacterized protein APZ42_029741 [Daphnia magna]|uniref:Uncharacterized protein n=1 Tax=Daphnia magna TaxID=35525 RepID=A0A164PCP0_9CRUS|nr:Uncharacterized protein APZ42_029741 [Daphnia magna]